MCFVFHAVTVVRAYPRVGGGTAAVPNLSVPSVGKRSEPSSVDFKVTHVQLYVRVDSPRVALYVPVRARSCAPG